MAAAPESTALRQYFEQHTHVGQGGDVACWYHATQASATTPEVIAWWMSIENNQIQTVRYQCQGSVLCRACCAWMAEKLEHRPVEAPLTTLLENMIETFCIQATQSHVPAMLKEAILAALQQYHNAA